MSPKKKDAKFQPVRVSQDLFDETKKCADLADEYMADYIRKAVEQRNAQYNKPLFATQFPTEQWQKSGEMNKEDAKEFGIINEPVDDKGCVPIDKDTAEVLSYQMAEKFVEAGEDIKPNDAITIKNDKKAYKSKSNEVKTFFKGGK